ncbi:hypothetical protein V1477_011825 [Vespula maculifrons]|uniref:Uncharacterized protein n=1 Tax=Vespula maculifrons TaxID=7453 RepID=A0ABD2C0A9_VESMC
MLAGFTLADFFPLGFKEKSLNFSKFRNLFRGLVKAGCLKYVYTARMFTLSFGVGMAPACVVWRIPQERTTIVSSPCGTLICSVRTIDALDRLLDVLTRLLNGACAWFKTVSVSSWSGLGLHVDVTSAGSCSSCRTGKSPNRTTTMGRRGISSIRPGVRVLRGIQEFHFASENGSTVCRIDPKTPTIPSFLDIYPLSGMSE